MNHKTLIIICICFLVFPEPISSKNFRINSYVLLENFVLALPDTHMIESFRTISNQQGMAIDELRLIPMDLNIGIGTIKISHVEDFGSQTNFSWQDLRGSGQLMSSQIEIFGTGNIIYSQYGDTDNVAIKSIYEDDHVQIMVLGKNSYELIKLMLENSKPLDFLAEEKSSEDIP